MGQKSLCHWGTPAMIHLQTREGGFEHSTIFLIPMMMNLKLKLHSKSYYASSSYPFGNSLPVSAWKLFRKIARTSQLAGPKSALEWNHRRYSNSVATLLFFFCTSFFAIVHHLREHKLKYRLGNLLVGNIDTVGFLSGNLHRIL